MRVYLVTFHAGTEGGLFGIDYGPDGYDEFSHIDREGREVYEVYTEYDIDRILDLRPQVAEYSRTDTTKAC